MHGLDDVIAGISGGGPGLALIAAVLLGLRHATDPDHLTAVSTLVLSDPAHPAGRARRAGLLGLCWGCGHATTLLLCGLPVVLLESALPAVIEHVAEAAVGVLIIGLAVRLLVRRRRGYLHMHPHTHGTVRHAHPHVHEHARGHPHPHAHAHAHAEALGRTPLAAYAIGLLHGVGGSAGVGILLVGSITGGAAAAAALVLFAGATALSMAVLSGCFGCALALGPALRVHERLVPVLGAGSLLFGAWYLAVAV